MACVVKGCTDPTRGKAIMCAKHWYALPETLREDVRSETDKGAHTLRATPSREWLAAASKHVGTLHNLTVQVGVDSKIKRKFDKS
jgi:hypothetical protein